MSNLPHDTLRSTHCYVTTHDQSGNAVFYEKPEAVVMKPMGPAYFNVMFATNTFPHEFDSDLDVKRFLELDGILPLSIAGGTVVRMVDLAPGEQSPMHRTTSLDYGVVLEGEVVLVLDNFDQGPRRLMKRGDVSVQRGTNHAWVNPSKDQWCRMLYVLVDAKPVKLDGRALPEVGEIEMPEQ
jgi:quercetin dioxygenase-like cupin family protein